MMASPTLTHNPTNCGVWSGHRLFSLENIYRAYRKCRRRKRTTCNALSFEQNLEENLLALHEDLNSGTYAPGRSLAFLVKKPKRREIFAADFRDRVAHHILVGRLERTWEPMFIHDSYACRNGKGTHKGVERLQAFTRKVTANATRQAWYLQLDIRGYFVTLDRNILYKRLATHEFDPAVLWLIRMILFNEATMNCRFRKVRRADFDPLPPHKTLFKARPACGLPIGNLTSQFFANVYLDILDQFVKHRLKARYYLRYCDDMVLLSTDKGELEEWGQQIEGFVKTRLRLHLNERRRLRPVSDGIDFLGYIVRPDYLLVRRRVVGALRERLEQAEHALCGLGMAEHDNGRVAFPWAWGLLGKICQWLNSYLGHFGKASSYRLIRRLRGRFVWLDEYFRWQEGKVIFRCPVPRHALRLSQQKMWFVNRLPGHIIMLQLGRFWEMIREPSGGCGKNNPDGLATVTALPCHFPNRRLSYVKSILWKSKHHVAWIGETGRRLTNIAERALMWRWGFSTDIGINVPVLTENEVKR